MAVLHYHVHRARPSGFARENYDVIRLMMVCADIGVDGVWLWRPWGWSNGRFMLVKEGSPLWPLSKS